MGAWWSPWQLEIITKPPRPSSTQPWAILHQRSAFSPGKHYFCNQLSSFGTPPPKSFPSNDYVIYEPPLGKLVSAKWSHRVEYYKERQHAKTQNVISPGTVAPTTFLPSSWISTDVAWRKCFTLNRASVMLCNWGMCYAIVGNKKYELNNPGIIVTKNGVIVYNHALWARSEENRGNHSDTPFSLQNKIIQPNHAYCLLVSCPNRFLGLI